MQFDGALVKEQGVCFAIAVVKPHVLNSTNKETVRNGFRQYFGQVPVILMAQNSRGTPIYAILRRSIPPGTPTDTAPHTM